MHEQRHSSIHKLQTDIVGRRYAGASLSLISGQDERNGFNLNPILEWMKSDKGFLILMGPPGVGKTYFCAALIEWISKKYNTFRYWHERDFFTRIRNVIKNNAGDYSSEVAHMF